MTTCRVPSAMAWECSWGADYALLGTGRLIGVGKIAYGATIGM